MRREWVSEWVSEWVGEWVSEWVREWGREGGREGEREWGREWVRERVSAGESEWVSEGVGEVSSVSWSWSSRHGYTVTPCRHEVCMPCLLACLTGVESSACMYACMHVCMYACMYVCMHGKPIVSPCPLCRTEFSITNCTAHLCSVTVAFSYIHYIYFQFPVYYYYCTALPILTAFTQCLDYTLSLTPFKPLLASARAI
jgi:hypothetical protein